MAHAAEHHLAFHADPAAFLAEAAEFLAARPVSASVLAVVTERIVAEDAAGLPREPLPDGRPYWWLVVRDRAGAVVGAAMRTAPFEPHPPYLLEMPDDAARLLARTLHERGERVDAVNGVLPASRTCADELARLRGGRSRGVEHLRLFELGTLVAPRPAPPGRLRAATAADVETCLAWFAAFGQDAAEQAGRTEPHSAPHEDRASMLRRIGRGDVFVWEDDAGRAVHVTGASAPSFGVARIGPVYTPRDQRGRGYASAAVAEVSRLRRDAGARVCLFTDQANPTSNRIYTALGYEPVEDQANHLVEPA